MRAWWSFHGQAHRSTLDSVIMAGVDVCTQVTVPGSYEALRDAVDGHYGARYVLQQGGFQSPLQCSGFSPHHIFHRSLHGT